MILFEAIENQDDRDFMESLYKRYYKMLFYKARNYCQDPETAEDIVHDAFEKLIQKIPLLRSFDCCRIRAYLVSTVRNTAITKSAKWKAELLRRADDRFEDSCDQIPDGTLSIEELLMRKELDQALAAALNTLDPKEQFMLEAKYFLQYSDQEIARVLRVQPASIRMKLTRTRRKVLKQLCEEANHGQDQETTTGKL